MRDLIRRRWPPALAALGVVIVAAVVAVAVAPASAPKASKTKPINAKVTLAQLSASGNTSKDAGEYVGTPGVRSAVLQESVMSGLSGTATGTVFSRVGKWKYEATFTAAVEPGGSVSFTGSGTVTGGTGRYDDASGHFTFTGTADSPSATVATFQTTGTIRF